MTNKHPLEEVERALEDLLHAVRHLTKGFNNYYEDEMRNASQALTTLREYMVKNQPVSEITENVLQKVDLKAMTKNAPTFKEVDLEEKQFYFEDGRLDVVASQYYNMAIFDIYQKYSKLYTKKGKQNDQ